MVVGTGRGFDAPITQVRPENDGFSSLFDDFDVSAETQSRFQVQQSNNALDGLLLRSQPYKNISRV